MKKGILRKMQKNNKGFTLIELMIVVAIIGILAAIAIPNFLRYQMKAKQAEAKTNIGAIKTSEIAYMAENDAYLVCAPFPGAAGTATTLKRVWGAAPGGFATIGYEPAGDVYFNYSVFSSAATATLAAGANMAISTEGELDADGAYQYFTLNTDGVQAGTLGANAPGTAYDIVSSGDDF